MADNRFLLVLDPTSGQDVLVRSAPDAYRQKSIRAAVGYMVQLEGDGVNPPYNASEREVALLIKSWEEEGKAQEAKPLSERKKEFVIAARQKSDGELIKLTLDDTMAKYEPMVQTSRAMPGGNSSETLPCFELFASLDNISGIYRLEYRVNRLHRG
ncbi:MAG: hypothetical protein KKC75_08385 [Nanoarchaeota archaeon]|nr:hypothetical protein [Nanoarchaeota archaeon]MBU1004489.1 hypothetical protein [Nanoarchaeota archaeon]MBU1945659.1 hypothetical protein [Nanoarchaeota archaeon]